MLQSFASKFTWEINLTGPCNLLSGNWWLAIMKPTHMAEINHLITKYVNLPSFNE
ncbi:protein of unknown function [Candidatus Nitrosocosmicus franklandus]|uniref:Uncharacterized protein n=1 Tax=Candidatus Nitrosocosmicus franklandianus TaxID=1798806 RepID=A0A484IG39_9ARCH|nr:protein of unknown function [Candidatus Nitrosocosmicus franklandus]